MVGSLTQILSYAFYNCDALTEIAISENVTAIHSYAFSECNALDTVMIPESVKNIANNTFAKSYAVEIVCDAESYAEQFAISVKIPYKYYFELGATITLELYTSDHQKLDSGYTVKWYFDNEIAGIGTTLYSIDESKTYEYEIVLDKELAQIYIQPPKGTVSGADNATVQVIIEKFATVAITGSVRSENNAALADAEVVIKQKLNGIHQHVVTVRTDHEGKFTATVYDILASLNVFADNCYVLNKELSLGSGEQAVDLGSLCLKELPQSKITLSYQLSSAMVSGEVKKITSLSHIDGLMINLYNRTKDCSITAYTVQDNSIILDRDTVAAYDVIEVEAWADAYPKTTKTVSLDEVCTAHAVLTFTENGKIKYKTNESDVVMYVFDKNGKYVEKHLATGEPITTSALATGTYQVVFMKRTDAITNISLLDNFSKFGLTDQADYLLKNISVQNGVITVIDRLPVPELDERKFEYSVPENTIFTANYTSVAVGRYVSLRAQYQLSDKVSDSSNEYVTFIIPDNLVFMEGSVTVDGKVCSYVKENNTIRVNVKHKSGTIRLYVIANSAADSLVEAYVGFSSQSLDFIQPIGTVTIQVSNATISMPQKTGRKSIHVNGNAIAESKIEIYCNGVVMCETVATKGGKWAVLLELPTPQALVMYEIYALITTPQQVVYKTSVQNLTYDATYAEVERVTVINSCGTEFVNVFEFLVPDDAKHTFTWAASSPVFTFTVEMTGDNVASVQVVTLNSSGQKTFVTCKYDKASGNWIGTHSYRTSSSVPTSLYVTYVPKSVTGMLTISGSTNTSNSVENFTYPIPADQEAQKPTESMKLLVNEVAPSKGGHGSITLSIRGTLLEPNAHIKLSNTSGESIATEIYWINHETVYATFDTSLLTDGEYDLVVSNTQTRAVLEKAFTVDSSLEKGALSYEFHIDSSINPNALVKGYITITNMGYTDMYVPVVVLIGNNVLLGSDENSLAKQQIVFMQHYEGLAGTLAPGQTSVYSFVYKAEKAGEFSFELIDFNCLDESLENRMVVDEASSPSDISLYYSYSVMGSSYREYALNMAKMANMLTGEKDEITIEELEDFYIQNTASLFGNDKIDSVVDMSSDNLRLIRNYQNPLLNGKASMFGSHWKSQYEMSAEYEVKNGEAYIYLWMSEVPRVYKKNNNGLFTGSDVSSGQFKRETNGEMVLTLPSGAVYRFNKDGRVISSTDLNGTKVTLTYQGDHVTAIESGNGNKLVLSYKDGKVSKIESALTGKTVEYEYEGDLLVRVKTLYGNIVYTYSSVSLEKTYYQLNKITYPDGSYVTYSYDQYGRVSQKSNGQITIFYEYGLNSLIVNDSLGNKKTYRYNENGTVHWVMDESNGVTYYTYNDQGDCVALSYGLLYTRENEYNALGDLIKTVCPDGSVVSYKYDAYGNIVSVVDSNNVEIKYQRDNKGNITAIVYPDGSNESYTYDTYGNILTHTKRSGVQITYTYDTRFNITKIAYSTGESIEYMYDDFENVTSIVENGKKTEMTYNQYGVLTQVIYPDNKTVTYAYDDLGRLISVTDADNYVTGYTYNSQGILQSVTNGSDTLVWYDYNPDGTLKRQTNANGTYTEYTYANGNFSFITNYGENDEVISTISYTYDSLGNLSSMTDGSGTWYYTYDRLGQLIGTVAPDGVTTQYSYDAAGNRTKVVSKGKETVYSGNALNQYTAYGNAIREYDTNGNLIKEITANGTATYEWDFLERLVKYVAHDGTVYQYGYDVFGLRNKVTVNGKTTSYVNDPTGYGFTLTEYGSNGTVHYNVANGIVASQSNGNTYYYNANHLGSVTEITDQNGSVVNNYLYNQEGDIIKKTEGIKNPYTYVGIYGIVNDGNGLIYDRARYVSVTTDSFISDDPLGQYADLNNYRYVMNILTNYVDVNGKWAITIGTGVSASAGAGVTGSLQIVITNTGMACQLTGGGVANAGASAGWSILSLGFSPTVQSYEELEGWSNSVGVGLPIKPGIDVGYDYESGSQMHSVSIGVGAGAEVFHLNGTYTGTPLGVKWSDLVDELYANYQTIQDWVSKHNPFAPKKEEANKVCGNTDIKNIIPKIDPSGYVYEGVTSNRIEGVKVIIYYEGYKLDEYGEIDYDAGLQMIEWTEAAEYGEVNPQITDILGQYGWDVIPGKWIVKYEKDGYAIAWSEWMTVPPEYTDVNINLQTLQAPTISSVMAYNDYLLVEFAQYMDIGTVNADSITVLLGNKIIAGAITPINAEFNFEKTEQYASIFKFVPTEAFATDANLTVDIANVKNYAGIVIGQDTRMTVTVKAEPKSIDLPGQVLVPYLEETEFVIQVLPADIGAGVTLRVESLSPSILQVLTQVIITNQDGKAVCKVKGQLPGKCGLIITVDGTSISQNMTCVVGDVDGEFDVCTNVVADVANGSTIHVGSEIILSSDTEDAVIYYTLDSSDPRDTTNLKRIRYEKPLVLESDTVVKAYAEKNGMEDSGMTILSYTVTPHEYAEKWMCNETEHWHVCVICNAIHDKSAHEFDEENTCVLCDYITEKVTQPDESESESDDETDDPTDTDHESETEQDTDGPSENNGDEVKPFVWMIVGVCSALAVISAVFCVYWFMIRKKKK